MTKDDLEGCPYEAFDAKLRLADMLIARDKQLIHWMARGKASEMPNQTYAEYCSEAERMLEEIFEVKNA